MVVFNPLKKEIDIKIVYYGPALCGKTTNLQAVHLNLNPQQRGELISLATKDDRTLFFDFLPIQLDNIKGFRTRFHMYTVPGQVFYTLTRKAVLTGVDGVIFVADSQDGKMKDNIESLNDLKENLKYYNKTLDSIPFVFQYNKRDMAGVIPVEEMNLQLNGMGFPFFEASAVNGTGVMETLTMCCKMVLKQIQGKSKPSKEAGNAAAAHAGHERPAESELPQLSIVEERRDEQEGVSAYPEAGAATGAVASDGSGSEKSHFGDYARDETVVCGPDSPDVDGESGDTAHFTDREPVLEVTRAHGQSAMTSEGLSLKKEGGDGLGLEGKDGSLMEDQPASYELKGEDEKKTCPRCSLKFKPNVKQCPICRINLVPGDTAETSGPSEPYLHEDLHGVDSLESRWEDAEDPETPAAGCDGRQLEIISCGQPQKASAHAIKIPVVMRHNPSKSELKIDLTISFDNGVHE